MATRPPTSTPPRMLDAYIDVPSQRLLAISLLVASQAIKLSEFIRLLSSDEETATSHAQLKWSLIDALLLWFIPYLRIPRLSFNERARSAQIIILLMLNWVLFGSYVFTWGRFLPTPIRSVIETFRYDELSIAQKRVKVQDILNDGSHLLGQHTVRLTPISTAKLNPQSLSYCLAVPQLTVFLPILLNNTGKVSSIQYSISPIRDKGPGRQFEIGSRELSKMQTAAAALFAEQKETSTESPALEQDEDDEDYFSSSANRKAIVRAGHQLTHKGQLEKTQSLLYIKIARPGYIRLERILDSSGVEVRISKLHPAATTMVVECPSARFEDIGLSDIECAGGHSDISILVRGSAPLTLTWQREIAGKKEALTVEGIEGNNAADDQPVTQDIRIPLTFNLDVPGTHIYTLGSLSDSAGNVVDLSPPQSTSSSITRRTVTVLARSAISFQGCGSSPSKSLNLLQGGPDVKLSLAISEDNTAVSSSSNRQKAKTNDSVLKVLDDGPWKATLRYEPLAVGLGKKAYSGWTRDVIIHSATTSGKKVSMPTLTVPVSQAGEYSILAVSGRKCTGVVMSPDVCRVVEVPKPIAEIKFDNIHECSGDTGLTTTAIFHGTPPFTLFYTTQRDSQAPKPSSRTFPSSRATIVLKPEDSGRYTYVFTHVSDKNYQKIPLGDSGKGISTTQIVHPLASAQFTFKGATNRLISNCAGRTVDVEVEMKGTPPFGIELAVVGQSGSTTHTFTKLRKPRETVTVPIPDDINRLGGSFEIDFMSVDDTNGCRRPLTVPGLSVVVKRVKPTVKFYSVDGKREVTVLEHEPAGLPLRLTGDGPWEITYQRVDPTGTLSGQPHRSRATSANENLVVKEKGLYTLLDVHDSHCPGQVVPAASTYTVDWISRPRGIFEASTGQITAHGPILRAPVCEGVEDHVEISLEGRAPYQVAYTYSGKLPGRHSPVQEEHTLSSIQSTARLQLKTSEPGLHEYLITHVGDSSYPLPTNRNRHTARRVPGLVLEQEVLARPSAYFKTASRASYCVNDPFVPRSTTSSEGTVVLVGKPPFKLHLRIKNLASSESKVEDVEVNGHTWRAQFSEYVFRKVGPYVVTIESFQDASGCAPQTNAIDTAQMSFTVDVAETAAIVPFERREDFCVGNILQFQLEGNAPWRVDYRFNSKLTAAISKTSKFSRLADKPGVFEVVSVAHQQALCQTSVSNIRMNIHDLPSARVSQGKNVIEDIREGDQAEIVFTLTGEPPFTFTYQRTAIDGKKRPEVMETHTVTGVMGHEYSVFSALEGTWTVTFVSDKHCRYPAAPSSSSAPSA